MYALFDEEVVDDVCLLVQRLGVGELLDQLQAVDALKLLVVVRAETRRRVDAVARQLALQVRVRAATVTRRHGDGRRQQRRRAERVHGNR